MIGPQNPISPYIFPYVYSPYMVLFISFPRNGQPEAPRVADAVIVTLFRHGFPAKRLRNFPQRGQMICMIYSHLI